MIHSHKTHPAYHGAFDYAELARLGLSPDDVIDFSVNSNPYGPPPGVRDAIMRVPLDRYPDRECLALRQRLATLHGVSMDQIVVGNGTAELLQLIAFAFLGRGTRVLMPRVTFSEYERVTHLVGATVLHSDMSHLEQAQCVFLCNPNNPDGTWIPPQQIIDWAQASPETLFVIDEAYSNFLARPQTVIGSDCQNILAVRSMTKDYALAGLRLGYVVGPAPLIEAIRLMRPAWNVNALAQAAGIAALESGNWLTETIAQLHDDKQILIDDLHRVGLDARPSTTHYFLIEVGDGKVFRDKLLDYGIMVRDCASFGLPQFIRLSTRTPQDNQRLLTAVEAVLT